MQERDGRSIPDAVLEVLRERAVAMHTRPATRSWRSQHKVTNWREYDASLRQRGSLTVWFTDEAVAAWGERRRARPGAGSPGTRPWQS